MKFGLALLAASAAAFPLEKRQEVPSTASAAASSAVESVLASATASGAAASASAAPDFGTGLLAALREREANTLAALLEPVIGQLTPVLSTGEWTIFAPGDEYLADVDTSNITALTETLTYHVVAGNYPTDALMENMTVIAPTLVMADMLGENYTTLPLAFVKDAFGTTNIVGQNASVLGNTTYENILIKLIDGVLEVPESVVSVASDNGADALVAALGSLLPEVAQTLNTTAGLTVFAPNNAALEEVSATLMNLAQSDPTSVQTAVQGHVLDSVVFSTNITDGLTVTSLGGTELTFMANETGVFVIGNGVTAQVVETDLIASNGVVHIIDALLFSPPAASASAGGAAGPVASASSAVASLTDSSGNPTGAAAAAASSATAGAGGVLSSVTAAPAAFTSSVGGVVGGALPSA